MIRFPRTDRLLWPALVFLLFAGTTVQAQTVSTVFGAGGMNATNFTMRISGTFGQPIIGTTTTPQHNTWQGFWVRTTAPNLSAGEPVAGNVPGETRSLRCFPNPVSKTATVYLHLPGEEEVTLTLHDALGREVLSLIRNESRSGESRLSFNVEEIAGGWYTLTLSAGDERTSLPVHVVQ